MDYKTVAYEYKMMFSIVDVIENIIKKTKEAELAGPTGDERDIQVWNIVSMLRGPDEDLHVQNKQALKRLTVSRLRHVIGMNSQYLDSNPEPLNSSEEGERANLLAKASDHFRAHWRQAVAAVKMIYGYDLDADAPVSQVEPKQETPKSPIAKMKKPAKKKKANNKAPKSRHAKSKKRR